MMSIEGPFGALTSTFFIREAREGSGSGGGGSVSPSTGETLVTT